MEYRLTGGWGITTMGGVVIVNESDSWDTRDSWMERMMTT